MLQIDQIKRLVKPATPTTRARTTDLILIHPDITHWTDGVGIYPDPPRKGKVFFDIAERVQDRTWPHFLDELMSAPPAREVWPVHLAGFDGDEDLSAIVDFDDGTLLDASLLLLAAGKNAKQPHYYIIPNERFNNAPAVRIETDSRVAGIVMSLQIPANSKRRVPDWEIADADTPNGATTIVMQLEPEPKPAPEPEPKPISHRINEAAETLPPLPPPAEPATSVPITPLDDLSLPAPVQQTLEELLAMQMQSVTVEIVGTWLWVDGQTKPHKEALKALGLKWHFKKGRWFYPDPTKKSRGGNQPMSKIRATYGSIVITDEAQPAAA